MVEVKVTQPITVTCQPGSVVILTEAQAEAVKGFVEEVKKPAPKKAAKGK